MRRSTEFRKPTSRVGRSMAVALVLIGVGGLLLAMPRPQGTPSRGLARRLNIGKSYALLIGNQAYEHLPRLETPVADVEALGRVLTGTYGFEVTLLLDADRSQMIDAFDGFVERLGEADRLLIYYAGHGHQDDATGEGYWLPVTARSNRRSEWVANNTVRDTLKATAARHVLVVADSCFAGTLTREASVGLPVGVTLDRYFEKLSNQRSRTALTSGGLEPVDDAGGGGHSVFAGALLDALEGSAGPILEASKLFSEIKRPVMLGSSGIQQPLFADIRQTGHQDGEFLFFRSPGAPEPVGDAVPGDVGMVAQVPPDARPAGDSPPVSQAVGGDSTAPSKGSYDEPYTGQVPPSKGGGEDPYLGSTEPPSKGGYDDEPYTGKTPPSKGSPSDEAPSKGSVDDEAAVAEEVLEVIQTSRQVESDRWDWEIHLEGPEWALDRVSRVVYHLHPTFRPSEIAVDRRDTRFQLQRTGWGTFQVRLVIEYRDGAREERRHQLRFR